MLVEIRCGPAMLIDRIEKVGTARKRRRNIEALTCKGNGFDPVVYKAVFNHIRAGNDVGRLTEGFKIWKSRARNFGIFTRGLARKDRQRNQSKQRPAK